MKLFLPTNLELLQKARTKPPSVRAGSPKAPKTAAPKPEAAVATPAKASTGSTADTAETAKKPEQSTQAGPSLKEQGYIYVASEDQVPAGAMDKQPAEHGTGYYYKPGAATPKAEESTDKKNKRPSARAQPRKPSEPAAAAGAAPATPVEAVPAPKAPAPAEKPAEVHAQTTLTAQTKPPATYVPKVVDAPKTPAQKKEQKKREADPVKMRAAADRLAGEGRTEEAQRLRGAADKPKKQPRLNLAISSNVDTAGAIKDFSEVFNDIRGDLAEVQKRTKPGSPEHALVQEYADLIAGVDGTDPSAKQKMDLKFANGVVHSMRKKTSQQKTEESKKLAKDLENQVSHRLNVAEIHSRLTDLADKVQDPAALKNIKESLSRLKAQQMRKEAPTDVDKADYREARALESSARKAHNKAEAAQQKQLSLEPKPAKPAKPTAAEIQGVKEQARAQKQAAKQVQIHAEHHQLLKDTHDQIISLQTTTPLDPAEYDKLEQVRELITAQQGNTAPPTAMEKRNLRDAMSALTSVRAAAPVKAQRFNQQQAAQAAANQVKAAAAQAKVAKAAAVAAKQQASAKAKAHKQQLVLDVKHSNHKAAVRDAATRLKAVASRVDPASPEGKEVAQHLSNLGSQQTKSWNDVTPTHRRDVAAALGAASRLDRSANKAEAKKAAAQAKAQNTSSEKFYQMRTKSAADTKTSIAGAMSAGRGLGARASEATSQEASAPTVTAFTQTALNATQSAANVVNDAPAKKAENTRKVTEVRKSLSEIEQDDTDALDDLEHISSIAKSLTGAPTIHGAYEFLKKHDSLHTQFTGYVRKSFFDSLKDRVKQSSNHLDEYDVD